MTTTSEQPTCDRCGVRSEDIITPGFCGDKSGLCPPCDVIVSHQAERETERFNMLSDQIANVTHEN
jgi:hypothetical protein